MNAEEVVKSLFGESIKNVHMNMINVNSAPNEGTNDTKFPKCSNFIAACAEFHSSLMDNLNSDKEKAKDINVLELADKIFTPIWFSPSSMKSRVHPVAFDGDHRTEKKVLQLGTYSTKQVVVNYENSTTCAVLASKVKYSSDQSNRNPELLIPEEGYNAKEVDYCLDRGMCNIVGKKTADICRYITHYKSAEGKKVVTLICGDYDFLSGSLNIFKNIFTHVETIKAQQKNKKKVGLDLSEKTISFAVKQLEKADLYDTASVSLARLIGGAIFTHDHLCVLRDVFGVKKLVAFDTANIKPVQSINIQTVIDDYSRIKKYYAMINSLKMI